VFFYSQQVYTVYSTDGWTLQTGVMWA